MAQDALQRAAGGESGLRAAFRRRGDADRRTVDCKRGEARGSAEKRETRLRRGLVELAERDAQLAAMVREREGSEAQLEAERAAWAKAMGALKAGQQAEQCYGWRGRTISGSFSAVIVSADVFPMLWSS